MLCCYICGREYGTKSLPIHIPQCSKKFLDEQMLKPPGERRPLPAPPTEEAIIAAASNPDAFNKAAYETWETGMLEKCVNCGRTFRPEALAHHKKACTADKPLRAAGTGLGAASLSNKPNLVSAPGSEPPRPPTSSGGRPRTSGAGMGVSPPPHAGAAKPSPPAKKAPAAAAGSGFGFCDECGSGYTRAEAKFCSECGAKRVG